MSQEDEEDEQFAALLPFQRTIISELIPPPNAPPSQANSLLILAKGLGLRTIVSAILQIYQDPQNLVLILNCQSHEERGFQEEPGLKLRVAGDESSSKGRSEMYKSGGIISVSSRVLVVDMLNEVVPIELITGLVVLHAEKVTPSTLDTFVTRVYRNKNKTGFLKAFSDQPEAFTFGMSPLQTTMQQLQLRECYIWPRFHQEVVSDLGKRKADVVELYQPLSDSLQAIQTALIQCMEATLSEMKQNNSTLEIDDFTVENALFSDFDRLVRAQLDPVWHQVGFKTKGLVNDLTVLRKLQGFLLELDAITFYRFLETIIVEQSTTKRGTANRHQSPWLLTDASNIIFSVAKSRVYTEQQSSGANRASDGWEEDMQVLLEMEGSEGDQKEDPLIPSWIPKYIQPVLEEQPKWGLLAEVLAEIEEDMIRGPVDLAGISNDTILIMCASSRECATLKEYLTGKTESRGRIMMLKKFYEYLSWKSDIGRMNKALEKGSDAPTPAPVNQWKPPPKQQTTMVSTALKRKEEWQRGQPPTSKRRRVRGGGAVGSSTRENTKAIDVSGKDLQINIDKMVEESNKLSQVIDLRHESDGDDNLDAEINEAGIEEYFGLLPFEDLVMIRPYSGDDDDTLLHEIRPKYIVLFDPNPAFVRRIETYRAAFQGLAVRTYFLIYKDSVEEQKYLSSIRKEKDAFSRLVREKGTMVITHEAEYRADDDAEILRTINSRAGGTFVQAGRPKVVIDTREFRSALPSMLHGANFEIIPATITIGDYILSPEICVERKSLPDLISSFNSGRLYQQCEQMSSHYEHPVLLIEFDEKRSFNLETYINSRASNIGRLKEQTTTAEAGPPDADLRAKIVLLTLSFPRLRTIWSSSPSHTVEIFKELKEKREEPDVDVALAMGLNDDELVQGDGYKDVRLGVTAVEMLRSLPGITQANYRYVMKQVESIEDLCKLTLAELQELIGVEKGGALHHFLTRNVWI